MDRDRPFAPRTDRFGGRRIITAAAVALVIAVVMGLLARNWAAFWGVLFIAAVILGLAWRERQTRQKETSLSTGLPPSEVVDLATVHMAACGFAVANVGARSVTFSRPGHPDAGALILLLVLGVLPGLVYYMLARRPVLTTLVAAPTGDDSTRIILSGNDPGGRGELLRWARDLG